MSAGGSAKPDARQNSAAKHRAAKITGKQGGRNESRNGARSRISSKRSALRSGTDPTLTRTPFVMSREAEFFSEKERKRPRNRLLICGGPERLGIDVLRK